MAARQIESDPGDRTEGMGKALKRRGLIAGAAALVAGMVATKTSQPVAADQARYDSYIAWSGGDVAFFNGSGYGYGVKVYGTGAGVWGIGNSASGIGVQGDGSGTAVGVLGNGGGTNGTGVSGIGNGSGAGVSGSGGLNGVTGTVDNSGYGVHGTAGIGYGVYGTALGGIGVGGDASNVGVMGRGGGDTSGNTTGFPIGVRGSVPNSGYGVYGNAGIGAGVYGTATNGVGTEGIATTGTGVYGQSSGDTFSMGVHGKHMSTGYGVYGESAAGGYGVTGVTSGDSASSKGVYGSVPNYGYGVYGKAGNGTGIYGTATGGYGVYGVAVSGNGVVGSTSGAGNVAGLYGTSSTTYGIIGNTTAAGYSGLTGITSTPGVAALAASSTTTAAYAAYFTGTTVVQGNFYVVKNPDGTGGGKFAAVAHADGSYRGVYCTESPEPWFEDFGEGKVVNGRVDVPLDPEFAALIHTDTYHVFLTAHSDQHLHVPQRTPTGFSVAMTTVGAGQGAATAAAEQTFSWRVVGKRKDIAGTRLPKVDLPKIKTPDPNNLPRLEPPKNKP